MTPQRWETVRELVAAALERAPEERATYLAEACRHDEALRREVESLVRAHDAAGDLFEGPAVGLAAEESAGLAAGQELGPYRLLSLLGKGGMGEVYLAEDQRLGRKLAIKLLPPAYTQIEERVRRFEQEARAASSLNHPNILTIYEIGQAAGTRFIAMEYVPGRTLREALQGGPLGWREALGVAAQVAGALEAAHASGVIHRDIKPENLMLRPDGYVKVLDFGLAKLIESPPAAGAGTVPGVVMGTASYMSPEQARGGPVDARSDVFSLGVVLYEMLAGRCPFEGASPSDVIASILEKEPPPLDRVVPSGLRRVVETALRKDRERRFQTMREMARELELLREGQAQRGKRAGPVARQGPGTGWRKLGAGILLALILTGAALAVAYYARREPAIESVAVIPFINQAADPQVDYLADGIAESLIGRLSRLPRLKVMSLSSVSRYKGREVDPRAVGRDLGVRAVLVGRLTPRGDELTISAELVDVRDNSRLWGHQSKRRLKDLMLFQEEISREISERLRPRLSGPDERELAKQFTAKPEAYRLYLQGRYYWNMRSEPDLRRAIMYFEQAVTEDPNFALAHAGLADCYGLLSNYSSTPPAEAMRKAKASAFKALELDETLAEAHASLGLVKKEYDWDFAGAEGEFRRAIELNPNYATAHQWRAENLVTLKRFDEAVAAMERARDLDPFSAIIGGGVGWAYFQARQFDQAAEQLRKTVEMRPDFARARFFLGRVYGQQGRHREAVEELRRALDLSGGQTLFLATLGGVYGQAGRAAEADAIRRELLARSQREYVSPSALALIETGLGDREQAFRWLEKAYQERDTILVNFLRDPQLDSLAADARFQELLRRLSLTP